MRVFVWSGGEKDAGKEAAGGGPGESLIRGCAATQKVRNVSRNPMSDLASGGKPAD